jgi:hypothetical protein
MHLYPMFVAASPHGLVWGTTRVCPSACRMILS